MRVYMYLGVGELCSNVAVYVPNVYHSMNLCRLNCAELCKTCERPKSEIWGRNKQLWPGYDIACETKKSPEPFPTYPNNLQLQPLLLNNSTVTMATTSTQQIPLTRLLTHLESTLSNTSSSNINTPAHRARIAANLEHARALHLQSEKSVATNNRIPAQRQGALEELNRQREWIRKLEGRLRELGEAGEEDDSDESDEEKGEDLLRLYAPARNAIGGAGLDVGGESQETQEDESSRSQQQQTQTQTQSSQQELRARKGLSAKDNHSAASTSARESLFANRPQQQETSSADISKTETLMSHNRTEQEALTTGLLGLASALKQSSINFSSSLEAERDVMKRAEGGLDKSAQGMEAAGKKMGTLRRMSEGQGWWGRIKLYAFIFGLWVACFLLVFIGPKLRF